MMVILRIVLRIVMLIIIIIEDYYGWFSILGISYFSNLINNNNFESINQLIYYGKYKYRKLIP